MVSQKLISDIVCEDTLEGAWRSFTVRVGKHRVVNFGRVETGNGAALRSLVGESGFIAIRVNGHEVIRKFNPGRKGSYQFMMPEYVGELKPREEVTVWVRPVSRKEFIEKAVESLPFGLKLKLEDEKEGILSIMDAISIPVRVTRFEWSEGNNALEVDLEFNGNGEKHVLAIAVKGEEKKATIRFRRTSGTIHSIRLGTVPSQIVVRYHDFKGRYFDHSITLYNVSIPKQRGTLELRLLDREEINKIKEWMKNKQQTLFGNKIKDMMVDAIIRTGEIAGIKIKPNKYRMEAEINKKDKYGKKETVDIVFESKNGKLIVVEVKATTDLGNIWEQFERAWKQLNGEPRYNKPGYIQLIKENGLKVFGKIRNDVEAYIIVVVMVNLETGLSSIEAIEEVQKIE